MSHPTPEAIEGLARDPSAGTASDRAHVTTCESCQAQVRDAAARGALLRGLRPYTLSDMAFRRVEARLMEAMEESARAPPFPWRWLAPLALGLLVVAFLQLRPPPPPVETPIAQAQRPRLPVPHVEPLTVLLASADAQVQAAGQVQASAGWKPLLVGQVVEPLEHVQGRVVGLAPASGVEWAFELKGALGLGEGASLAVTRGELVARVRGTEVDIAVGGLHVVATEAVFSVERMLAEVVVEVDEGTVELVDSSFERRQVRAPSRLRLADGAALSVAVEEPVKGVRRLAVPVRPWVHFDASSLPGGTRLSLDGAFLGEAPLSALVASGRHRLGMASPGEAMHESWVELTGRYVVRLSSPPPRVEPPAAEPDEAQVARIEAELQRQRPKLKACYEKWLKANPDASAEVELRLVVSASGRVREASVKGELSGAPAECLVRTARALSLPPLGREVEVEVPLRLTTQRE